MAAEFSSNLIGDHIGHFLRPALPMPVPHDLLAMPRSDLESHQLRLGAAISESVGVVRSMIHQTPIDEITRQSTLQMETDNPFPPDSDKYQLLEKQGAYLLREERELKVQHFLYVKDRVVYNKGTQASTLYYRLDISRLTQEYNLALRYPALSAEIEKFDEYLNHYNLCQKIIELQKIYALHDENIPDIIHRLAALPAALTSKVSNEIVKLRTLLGTLVYEENHPKSKDSQPIALAALRLAMNKQLQWGTAKEETLNPLVEAELKKRLIEHADDPALHAHYDRVGLILSFFNNSTTRTLQNFNVNRIPPKELLMDKNYPSISESDLEDFRMMPDTIRKIRVYCDQNGISPAKYPYLMCLYFLKTQQNGLDLDISTMRYALIELSRFQGKQLITAEDLDFIDDL